MQRAGGFTPPDRRDKPGGSYKLLCRPTVRRPRSSLAQGLTQGKGRLLGQRATVWERRPVGGDRCGTAAERRFGKKRPAGLCLHSPLSLAPPLLDRVDGETYSERTVWETAFDGNEFSGFDAVCRANVLVSGPLFWREGIVHAPPSGPSPSLSAFLRFRAPRRTRPPAAIKPPRRNPRKPNRSASATLSSKAPIPKAPSRPRFSETRSKRSPRPWGVWIRRQPTKNSAA